MPHPSRVRRLTLAALALMATVGPASAFEDAFGAPAPYRTRVIHRPVRVYHRPIRVLPPPVIVNGYLPRNHNVPMYNEPPRLSAYGPR